MRRGFDSLYPLKSERNGQKVTPRLQRSYNKHMNQRGFSQKITPIILGVIVIVATTYFILTKKLFVGSSSYVGILSATSNCMIPEGCGPKYRLFDSNLQSYTPLLGRIKESDSGLIIKATGSRTTLPKAEYDDMNYRGPTEAIQVSSYSVLSEIPYHDFLVNKSGEYTVQKYPCLAHTVYGKVGTNYDKTFSWELEGNTPTLKVKMTGSKGSYELWYDGNSGDFIKEVVEPKGTVFCQ